MRLLSRREIPRVQLLTLRPDDLIILETTDRIPTEHFHEMRAQAAEAFGVDESRVIIVRNATVKVLREGEPPPPSVIVNPGRWP